MRIMVIPDTQVAPGDRIDHLKWAGKYAAKKQPDVIVHIGDHFDMPSLCTYDVGTKSFEGRAYKKDIAAGRKGMRAFLKPIRDEQAKQRRAKSKIWKPRLVFTLGNHENRINRAVEMDRKLEGLMSIDDLRLESMGWEVYPYLEPIKIAGVMFCHFFTSGTMGRPCTNARLMLNKKHISTVMGHVQDRDIAYAQRADGSHMTAIFAGIFYQEDQGYLTPQTNNSWRGIWMLHEVRDGEFDEMPVSLDYLRRKYGT